MTKIIKYVVADADGRILRFGFCGEGDLVIQANSGETVIEANTEIDPAQYYVANGVLVPIPGNALSHHRFDYTTKQWVYDQLAADHAAGEIVSNLAGVVQQTLDETARTRNYDGILSLCSYASSPHPKFGPEGLAGVAWRDAVWAKCYEILAEVEAGTRPVPSEAELIAELPPMIWPS